MLYKDPSTCLGAPRPNQPQAEWKQEAIACPYTAVPPPAHRVRGEALNNSAAACPWAPRSAYTCIASSQLQADSRDPRPHRQGLRGSRDQDGPWMSEEGTPQMPATVGPHPGPPPHCGEKGGWVPPCLLLTEHQTKHLGLGRAHPRVWGARLLQPSVPRDPHLNGTPGPPCAHHPGHPPRHLQRLALLPVPPWCLGAPCPHLHQQAGQGAPPPHPHHHCLPSTPSLCAGQLEAASDTETGASGPALVAAWALRRGPACPKQGG